MRLSVLDYDIHPFLKRMAENGEANKTSGTSDKALNIVRMSILLGVEIECCIFLHVYHLSSFQIFLSSFL